MGEVQVSLKERIVDVVRTKRVLDEMRSRTLRSSNISDTELVLLTVSTLHEAGERVFPADVRFALSHLGMRDEDITIAILTLIETGRLRQNDDSVLHRDLVETQAPS